MGKGMEVKVDVVDVVEGFFEGGGFGFTCFVHMAITCV